MGCEKNICSFPKLALDQTHRDAKPYLSVIIGCYDGRIVSWAASGSPDAELANSTLEAAVASLAPARPRSCTRTARMSSAGFAATGTEPYPAGRDRVAAS